MTSGVVLPGGSAGPADIGQQIQWRYTVTNVGNVTVTTVTIDDPEGGSITCAAASVAPGHSVLCTSGATHTVTEADIIARAVSNSASAVASPSTGGTVASGISTATVTTAAARTSLALTTTIRNVSRSTGPASQGDELQADYVVTNIGNLTIHSVTVSDSTFGTATCTPLTLAPGESASCSADALYTVTPSDVAAGRVLSSAVASGIPPTGSGLQLATLALVTTVDVGTVDAAALGVTGVALGATPLVALLLMIVGTLLLLVVARRRRAA